MTKSLTLVSDTKRLREYDPEELFKEIQTSLKFIAIDLNIRNMEPYDEIRFVDYLTKYFKFLTVEDVKIMFELYLAGKLELRDDVKPYHGAFSASFYMPVIRAYVDLKRKDEVNQRLALPEPKITQERIDEIHKDFQKMLVSSYTKLKETGNISYTTTSLHVYEYWLNKGLIEGAEVTDADRALAMRQLVDDMSKKTYKEEIKDETKKSRARLLSYARAVRELYLHWIENEVNIEDKIKYDNDK